MRGGRPLPDDAWIDDAANQSQRLGSVDGSLLSLDENRCTTHERLISQAPKGGELSGTHPQRLLQRLS